MRIIALAALLLVAFGIAFAAGQRARAHNNFDVPPCKLPYGGGGSYLSVYWHTHPTMPPTGFYATAYLNQRAAWNGTATPVWFTNGGGASHGAKTLPAGTVGRTVISCNGAVATVSAVWVDQNQLNSYSDTLKSKAVGHELGHNITLGHSNFYSLMKQGIVNVSSSPTTDDICGVNTRYISTTWPAEWYCFI